MKKKGFTLIELLAVIVILAIIALISIPLIGNVIEKAKIGALENSVNGLVESANMYYANQSVKGENPTETIFDFANGEQVSTEKLEYKGKVYNGKLILHANGEVAVCIDDKEHYAYKNKDTDEIVSGIGTCLYDGTTGDFSSNSPVEDLKKQVAAATATSDKVLEGSTIYTLSGLVAGTMANNANKTLSATTVTESEDKANALINIPSSGYYDETSQISVPIETIKNDISSIVSSCTGSGLDIIYYSLYVGSGADGLAKLTIKNNGVKKVKFSANASFSVIYVDGTSGTKTFTANTETDISDVFLLYWSLSRNSSGGSGSSSVPGYFTITEQAYNKSIDITGFSMYVGSGADGVSYLTLSNNGVKKVKFTGNASFSVVYKDGTSGTKAFTANTETDISNIATFKWNLSRNSNGGSGTTNGQGRFIIVE